MVNRRANTLIEPEVTLMLMAVQRADGSGRREFKVLKLERDKVMLFPLTWTIVHPIDADSPLYGKSAADLQGDGSRDLSCWSKPSMKRSASRFTSASPTAITT